MCHASGRASAVTDRSIRLRFRTNQSTTSLMSTTIITIVVR